MVGRSRARYLAPIALAATIAGTYLIVHEGLKTKHKAPATPVTARPRVRPKFRGKFYFVKPGENLTTIAKKTGIPLAKLEALNPRIDPNALQAHQRLRLRR
jgi:LysM domain